MSAISENPVSVISILQAGHKKIKEKVMKRKKREMPGVKAGSRRAAAVTLTVLLAAVCGGCGNQ